MEIAGNQIDDRLIYFLFFIIILVIVFYLSGFWGFICWSVFVIIFVILFRGIFLGGNGSQKVRIVLDKNNEE